MKKGVLAAAVFVSLLMATGVQARGLGEILEECGFGGMVFPENTTHALISNLLFSPGVATTSGITTPDQCKGGAATAAVIIRDSYEQIEKEIAAGQGEYLSLLAGLVKGEGQTEEEFVAQVRVEFTELVSQPRFARMDRAAKAEALYDIVVN